jgi:hypothetical protein
VENQIEKINKAPRMDNGGELCRNEFEDLCKKCSIERKKTSPYTPQHKWSCRKDEQEIDGKIKVQTQWCRVRTRFLGRGSGYCMVPGQSINLINIGG